MFEEFHGIPLANDSTICDPFMALKVLLGGISCLVGALFECALLFEFFVACMYLFEEAVAGSHVVFQTAFGVNCLSRAPCFYRPPPFLSLANPPLLVSPFLSRTLYLLAFPWESLSFALVPY